MPMTVFDLEELSVELERARDLLQVGLEEIESLPCKVQHNEKEQLAMLQIALNRNKITVSLLNSSLFVLSDVIKTLDTAVRKGIGKETA